MNILIRRINICVELLRCRWLTYSSWIYDLYSFESIKWYFFPFLCNHWPLAIKEIGWISYFESNFPSILKFGEYFSEIMMAGSGLAASSTPFKREISFLCRHHFQLKLHISWPYLHLVFLFSAQSSHVPIDSYMAITCCMRYIRSANSTHGAHAQYTRDMPRRPSTKKRIKRINVFSSFFLPFKFIALICLLLPLSSLSHPTEVHGPHVDIDHYKYITNEILVRPKRAGSFDFVGAIKNVSDSLMRTQLGWVKLISNQFCRQSHRILAKRRLHQPVHHPARHRKRLPSRSH